MPPASVPSISGKRSAGPQRWEAVLNERDLISVPPGVYREETNIGDEDALMCVMLGTPKPITPTYPPDSPLAKIKRDMLANAAK